MTILSSHARANTSSNWVKIGTTSNGNPVMLSPSGQRFVSPVYEPFNGNYKTTTPVNGVISSGNGVVSTQSVKATIVTKAPKKSVVSGVVSNAFKAVRGVGGTVAKRSVYGIALSILLDAMNKDSKGNPLPPQKQYKYDPEVDNFVRDGGEGAFACIYRVKPTYGYTFDGTDEKIYSGHTMSPSICADGAGTPMLYDDNDDLSAARQLCRGSSKLSFIMPDNYALVGFDLLYNPLKKEYNKTVCEAHIRNKKTGEISTVVTAMITFGQGLVSKSVWDGEVGDAPDRNPTKWVEASVDDDGNIPDAETTAIVDDGQVAQTPPYTKDGKAVQTRWDFETKPSPENDGLGSTKVKETEIPRPDLKPNSPEAPAPKGTPTTPPKDGDKDKDKDKDPNSDDTPTPKDPKKTGTTNPPSDDNPPSSDDDDKNKDADKDKEKQPEVQGLCDQYPDILACQKMGNVEEGFFDDIKIPNKTDDKTWSEDPFLPSDGVCPAPKTFHVAGKQFEISYEPLCKLMRDVRFIILIGFILLSAYITFGSLRKGA